MLLDVIKTIAVLCQLHGGDPVIINNLQTKCHAYYLQCMVNVGESKDPLWVVSECATRRTKIK